MTIKQVVFQYLDSCPEKLITGWCLFDEIRPLTGRETYPSTLIEYCKLYADITSGSFKCVNRQKSIYKFILGFGIGSARIEGIE
jgi:hypothetical protein